MSFKVISMFSGAGGLDLGFHNKGFEIIWANDFNKDACETYDRWANHNADGSRKPPKECTTIVHGDISKLPLAEIVPKDTVDVILGGFPCQGFSLAGPRQVDDSRNVLYRHFVEMVRLKRPKVLVAENVIGIKTLGGGAVFQKIIHDFRQLGYSMSAPTVNAKDFGVPQDRMRVIFIGIREDLSEGGAYRIPLTIQKEVTLREGLQGLPPVEDADICQAAFSPRYMSRNRKRGYDEVSFTIPAMAKQVTLSPDSEGMIQQGVDRFAFIGTYNRRLSYKEAAAIQTFPLGMEFCGDLESKYKQIGNAVPVKLAEAIAGEVLQILTTPNLTSYLNFANPEQEITRDQRITTPMLQEKSFAYAMLRAFYDALLTYGFTESQLTICQTQSYQNLKEADALYEWREQSALFTKDASTWICKQQLDFLEDIELSTCHVQLLAQSDEVGHFDDPRDLRIQFYQGDTLLHEIGLSLTNQTEAVRYFRLSNRRSNWSIPEFTHSKSWEREWDKLKEIHEKYLASNLTWTDFAGKEDEVYLPILRTIVRELVRQTITKESDSNSKKNSIACNVQALFRYFFGTHDYYRVYRDYKNGHSMKLYPFDIQNSLFIHNYKNKRVKKYVSAPSEILDVAILEKQKDTIELTLNQWTMTMRIYNVDGGLSLSSFAFQVELKPQLRKIGPIVYRETKK